MRGSITVAAIQLKKADNKEENFRNVSRLVNETVRRGNVDLVCLPEKWNIKEGNPLTDSESPDGPSIRFLESIAEEYGVYVLGGSVWEKWNGKVYNVSRLMDRSGRCIGVHRKIHLYGMEKQFFEPGNSLEPCETEFGKVGLTVCFDLAFPEVARILTLKGADIILNPAFIPSDGVENWHIYVKARALENRVPVVGINSVSFERGVSWPGESIIVGFHEGYESPAKLNVLVGKRSEEDILIQKVDLDYPRHIRAIRLSERAKIIDELLSLAARKHFLV
ncbi:MAG: carbon-nitrogen hydrolase family protein [Candidatus Jordarchaeales archaeon]